MAFNLMARLARFDFLPIRVLRRFISARCAQTAAGLAFVTLIGLVPIMSVTVAVLARLPDFADFGGHVEKFLLSYLLPQRAGDVVAKYALMFSAKAADLTRVGALAVAVTATLILHTIDRELNVIFRVGRTRPLWKSFLLYLVLLMLGPAVLGALLAGYTYFLSASFGIIPTPPWARGVLVPVATLLPLWLLLAGLFAAVPNRSVRARDALIGGAVAVVGLESSRATLAWYFAQMPSFTVLYGAFWAVPVFLLWLQLSWGIVLVGALVCAELDRRTPAQAERKRRSDPASDHA
ncbi:MAG: YihY family inner membrane protein [Rhodocyclaceae bacterium]|nr:YihY family inner membrane protein [Rhodocyclaceae bacterium]